MNSTSGSACEFTDWKIKSLTENSDDISREFIVASLSYLFPVGGI